ncbi:MAG: aminotransferase class I/II-fold pyridoxal phosphate-dependent enzyme, partial [Oscillospiraceae bacterium]|nr:aminotransferase class I/II-fold pyridoxal phosphate-dependent enzyme [Oscillospiraceae bacterium]
MQDYHSLSQTEREALRRDLQAQYDAIAANNLKLDMSRGKPGADQLALSSAMLDSALLENPKAENGFDCRNYGLMEGVPETRALLGRLMDLPPEQVIASGNSSLTLMFDYIAQCVLFGAGGIPWAKQEKISFLCPVPGYDRHFTILQHFGIPMIPIPMREEGPDMALITQYVRDETVKGMICVPKYSNPEGKTFSEAVVRQIAALKPAAKDFRVIWDNAYCVHDLESETVPLLNIFEAASEHGTEDHFVEVTSFSKITFPGAGIAGIGASPANIAAISARMNAQTISADKLNHLRHARYFASSDAIRAHMQKHAAILRPKFRTVLKRFEQDLSDGNFAQWTNPKGGYFISLNVPNGCAKRTVELCKNAG